MSSLIDLIAPLALAAAGPQVNSPPAQRRVPEAAGDAGGATRLPPRWTSGSVAAEGSPVPPVSEGGTAWSRIVDAFREPSAEQVRIDQRVIVRIAPRSRSRDLLVDLPRMPLASKFKERKVGKCLAIKGIAGVQIGPDDRLLLFMRDQRLIGASLEKACAARDFYSGFYLDRNEDGKLCVDRDMLHSRSGSTCSLSRLRELVAVRK